METVKKSIIVDSHANDALSAFTGQIHQWWPAKYTWSQEVLQELKINPSTNGLFTEIGPNGFRADWGRVLSIEAGKIIFLWQIGPQRTPEPNPEKASTVEVNFKNTEEGKTIVDLEHRNFEKHGEGFEEYRNAMDSEHGWESILAGFRDYLRKKG
jgi:uncharacterized protein YndB with AHSA1/START domain